MNVVYLLVSLITLNMETNMAIKSLIKTWALPDRSQDRQQLTLRLQYDLYAKLHALKEIYPNRPVNDMINDILRSGLEEIIEALPTYSIDEEEALELAHHTGQKPEAFFGTPTGPSVTFQHAYARILNAKADTETKSEEAA